MHRSVVTPGVIDEVFRPDDSDIIPYSHTNRLCIGLSADGCNAHLAYFV